MSCLSKTLSQTRDSPAPGSGQRRVRASAGLRPPEYCAGYCRPASCFWQRCNFSLPQAGVSGYLLQGKPPNTPTSTLPACRQQPLSSPAEFNNRAIRPAFYVAHCFHLNVNARDRSALLNCLGLTIAIWRIYSLVSGESMTQDRLLSSAIPDHWAMMQSSFVCHLLKPRVFFSANFCGTRKHIVLGM